MYPLKRAKLITIKEYMELYKKPRSTAYKDVHLPGFPIVKVGQNQIRIDETRLDEFFTRFN